MSDFVIDDAAAHYAASKSLEYQARVTERFQTLITFLQEKGLTTRIILANGTQVPKDLKLFKSDLTDEGFEVIKSGYHKWLLGIDNGKPISDIAILEKALKKIRKG